MSIKEMSNGQLQRFVQKFKEIYSGKIFYDFRKEMICIEGNYFEDTEAAFQFVMGK